jgi:hypothetical protein
MPFGDEKRSGDGEYTTDSKLLVCAEDQQNR